VSIIALVLFAIGWREAIVVAIVIPVTILLTLFAALDHGLHAQPRVAVRADLLHRHPRGRRHRRDREHRPPLGHERRQAPRAGAIEAVAEVGNPTIVATLTVVAALLPMLFVSGLMGPYMSPIPANASAAMIFSFFVAVIVTPWLMAKIAGGAPVHDHEPRRARAWRQARRALLRFARPILATKGRSLAFLLITAALSLGSLALLYTKDVTVKLLPFDNKSELAVVIDMPEGTSVEATDAVAQAVARTVRKCPRSSRCRPMPAPPRRSTSTAWCATTTCASEPHMGDLQINLTPKTERDRESHEIALEIRERISGLDVPEGTSLKVVEPPPGPPVISTLLAEVYGPDAETRRRAAAKIREAFEACPSSSMSTTVSAARRERCARQSTPTTWNSSRSRKATSSTRSASSIAVDGRLFASRRRPSPDPDRVERAKGDRVLDERFLSTPIPANVLPGARGVVELGDVIDV
jgi:multidrug efflux pump subunit AcrB